MGTSINVLHSSIAGRTLCGHIPTFPFSSLAKLNCSEVWGRNCSVALIRHHYISNHSLKAFFHDSEERRVALEDSTQPSSAIDFLTLCHSLKTTKRKGWVLRGLKNAESVSDHMYRMALMALIVNDVPGVNRDRCVKMALVHDIAEAIVGDITPSDRIPKEEKSRREREALDKMCSMLGGGKRADEIRDIWNEYENNSSLEAKLVKDFDKVELILQALEYENEHGKELDEFFKSTKGKFQTDVGKAWAAEILTRRKRGSDHSFKKKNIGLTACGLEDFCSRAVKLQRLSRLSSGNPPPCSFSVSSFSTLSELETVSWEECISFVLLITTDASDIAPH